MAAKNAKGLAVRRPGEARNLFRAEVGHLTAFRAIKRLVPEIIHPVFTHRINNGLTIGSEFGKPGIAVVSVEKAGRLPRTQIDERNLLDDDAGNLCGVHPSKKSQQL